MTKNYEEILNQLNQLTAEVKELITNQDTVYDDGEGTQERVSGSSDDGYYLNAEYGYNQDVDLLCKVEDTGNGYIAYFPTYSSVGQNNYICMDYVEADYLFKILKYAKSTK